MKLFYGLMISSVLILSSLGFAYAQLYHDFPPTRAFKTIFADSGNVTAQTYYGNVTFIGNNLVITPDYANNIITFTGTSAKSNGTVNSLTCPANQFFNSYNNGTHTFTCGTPSASGSGTTLDTIENLTPAQGYIYKKNNTNTNFQFYGVNGTNGITVSNGTTILTIKGTVYQNNTGSNLGTHGSGVFDSMSGSILQFLKILSTNNLLGVSSNSTNILLTVQNVITNAFKSNSITCAAGSFFSAFSNTTGTYTCTAGNSGTVTGSHNGGHASGSVGTLATGTSSQVIGRNFTGTGVISVTKTNDTDASISCPTCSTTTGTITTSQNVGKATGSKGVLATPTSNVIKGKNMSSTRTDLISFSTSNSTDIIASSSFKSNTITCTNQFISAFNNSTGLYTCSNESNKAQGISLGYTGAANQAAVYAENSNATRLQFHTLEARNGIALDNGTTFARIGLDNGILNSTTYQSVSAIKNFTGTTTALSLGYTNLAGGIGTGLVTIQPQASVWQSFSSKSTQIDMRPPIGSSAAGTGQSQSVTMNLYRGATGSNGLILSSVNNTGGGTIKWTSPITNQNLTITTSNVPTKLVLSNIDNSIGFTNALLRDLKIVDNNDFIVDEGDNTKKLGWQLSAATTGTTTQIRYNQTQDNFVNSPPLVQTETYAMKPQNNFTASSNKTGTTTKSMLGDGVTLTPTVTGRILITVSGSGSNSVAGDGGQVQISRVTGGCPANAAAITGTLLGSNIKMWDKVTTASSAGTTFPFGISFQTTGLTINQKYCFELTQAAITGGTFTVTNVMWTATEY